MRTTMLRISSKVRFASLPSSVDPSGGVAYSSLPSYRSTCSRQKQPRVPNATNNVGMCCNYCCHFRQGTGMCQRSPFRARTVQHRQRLRLSSNLFAEHIILAVACRMHKHTSEKKCPMTGTSACKAKVVLMVVRVETTRKSKPRPTVLITSLVAFSRT